ncbi:hypothetical protein MNBD_ALPHA03-133 [hydrothermal vent metagenome]|uniref:Uncharacterized protein n=1 Tax=hydrothermal vent metagenome TaxID=652676 RepID=A0A3B1B2T8_9ZZZZ
MYRQKFLEKMLILLMFSGLIIGGSIYPSISFSASSSVSGEPLRIVIRPRKEKQEIKPLISPEVQRNIDNSLLKFDWRDIFKGQFLSGYEDTESFQDFGYSTNAMIGKTLRDKERRSDDPDNMLYLKEYRGRQLYSGAPLVIIQPMREIKQGCKDQISGTCGFKRHGQFWLKFGLRELDMSRDRFDRSLVNLIKSLD